MRWICKFLTLGFLLFGACTSTQSPEPQSENVVQKQIHSIMTAQEQAWNQGDIEGFMSNYNQTDSLVFSGAKSITFGWQQAVDRYKRSYPDKEAMGQLNFSDTRTKLLSEKVAFTTGQWNLERKTDTISGRFTLVWKLLNNEWLIIADHSS